MNCTSCKNPIQNNSTECEWCGNKLGGIEYNNKTKDEIIVNCYNCNNPIDILSSACEWCNTPITLEIYNMAVIKSPLDGIIYFSYAPDKPQFAKVGENVSLSKVVCVIEAMGLFHEIESEGSGRIVRILLSNGGSIKKNQPILIIHQNNNNYNNAF